jgi:Fe-S cluster assembly ATP-binding protein
MLHLKNLSVRIADKEILHNIFYDFKPGVVYAIMGPNGSGKSTLAQTVMGSPTYELDKKSQIIFKGENINKLTADERAKKGIFLSFQSPQSLAGVTVFQLLRLALTGKKEAVEVRDKLVKIAGELKIPDELLSRSLNEDFSGGEKKKMEVLQAAMLDADVMFFDEIDTGTDVDALKIIGEYLHKLAGKKRTIVLITHYTRLLSYVAPDVVLILKNGKLVKEAKGDYANEIEKTGYANV